mgnify:CR=1 FL=1
MGFFYPQNYILKNYNATCICSKIAPAADGYIELVISINENALTSNDVSIYLKEGDLIQLKFRSLDDINAGRSSTVSLRITTATPNLIEYTVADE